MSKKLFPLLFCILAGSAFSQQSTNASLREANYFYQSRNYIKAIKYFEEYTQENQADVHTNYKMALSYYMNHDFDEAYNFLLPLHKKHSNEYPLATYYLAETYKALSMYEKAAGIFEEFIATHTPTDSTESVYQQAIIGYNGCFIATLAYAKPIRDYQFTNISKPTNTIYSEFSPSLHQNDSILLFASNQEKKFNKGKTNDTYGENYTSYYTYELKDSTGWKKNTAALRHITKALNSKYNEGGGVFNSEKNEFLFTRCDIINSQTKQLTCGIYSTQLKNNKWSKAKLLNKQINLSGYHNSQPALSGSNDTLFFTSNRPGGEGGFDIWMSTKTNEKWTNPINLGKTINTPFTENAPFIIKNHPALFFSSNGHESLGGMDIFYTNYPHFNSIRNVGLPFNSGGDDLSVSLGENAGVMTSNRLNGIGHDDIYQFIIQGTDAIIAIIDEKMPIDNNYSVCGNIKNETGHSPSQGTIIKIETQDKQLLASTATDHSGNFEFKNLQPQQGYIISLDEEKNSITDEIPYIIDNFHINTYPLPVDSSGVSIEGRILNEKNIYQHKQEVWLLDLSGNKLQATFTDINGKFKFICLPTDRDYQVVLLNKQEITPIDFNIRKIVNLMHEVDFTKENDTYSSNITLHHAVSELISIRGRLIDEKGLPVVNALLSVHNAKNEKIQYAISEFDGSFKFTDLEPNNQYTIIIENLQNEPNGNITASKIQVDQAYQRPMEEIKEESKEETTTITANSDTTPLVDNFTVHFRFNSYYLNHKTKASLDRLKSIHATNIELHGYTDISGHKDYNLLLSKQRTEAVYQYLLSINIAPEKINQFHHGTENTIGNQSEIENRKLSRRVEIKIVP